MLSALIATAVISPATGPTITRVRTFEQFRTIAVASASTGHRFAASLENHEVRIIDAGTLQTVLTLRGHPQPVYAVAFSPDGRWIATGDESARIRIWNARTGAQVREFSRERGHIRGIQALAFPPGGGSLVSVGKDDTIRVWSLQGGNPTQTIAGNGANFFGASFSPAGALLTATLAEGARLYAPRTYTQAAAFRVNQGANDVDFNPAGTQAVMACRDGAVVLWDVPNRRRITSIGRHDDWVIRTTFSPNGRLVASSSSDGTVRVWEVRGARQVARIDDQSGVGSPVTFTASGAFLITTSSSDALQVHSVTPAQAPAAPRRRR